MALLSFLYPKNQKSATAAKERLQIDIARARNGRGGAVAIIQRFGAALNLNVHVHALVLDGVYAEEGGIPRFHEAIPPTDEEMHRLLETIDRRVHRLLARPGCAGRARRGERPRSVAGGGTRPGRHRHRLRAGTTGAW